MHTSTRVQTKLTDPSPAEVYGFTLMWIYSFTSLLAPLALGYGPDSRSRDMRRTATDTQGPGEKSQEQDREGVLGGSMRAPMGRWGGW